MSYLNDPFIRILENMGSVLGWQDTYGILQHDYALVYAVCAKFWLHVENIKFDTGQIMHKWKYNDTYVFPLPSYFARKRVELL